MMLNIFFQFSTDGHVAQTASGHFGAELAAPKRRSMRISSSSPQTDVCAERGIDGKLDAVAELPLSCDADAGELLPRVLLRSAELLKENSGGGSPLQPGGEPGGGPGGAFNARSRNFASMRATASFADPNLT